MGARKKRGRGTTEQQPRRLLMYFPFCRELTGGARTLLDLVAGLDREAFAPIVVTSERSPFDGPLRALGVLHIKVPYPENLEHVSQAMATGGLLERPRLAAVLLSHGRLLQRLGREHGVAAIWTRNLKGVLPAAYAARSLGVPLVWDIGVEPPSRGLVRILHLASLGLVRQIVTQAPSQASDIFGTVAAGLVRGRVHSVYPGIAKQRKSQLDKARMTYSPTWRHLLCVGALHPRKNQLQVLQAFRQGVAGLEGARLDLVGPATDAAYAARLTRVISDAGLQERVRLLGWRDDIPELMAQACGVVLASRNEGVPHVVREAMYLGRPVIATRVGGVADVVSQKTGWMVPPNDLEALSEALLCCLHEPAEAARRGQRGRERAQQLFCLDTWLREYNQLLMGLTSRSLADAR